MPNETGVGFLSKIADQYPDIIKILSTAYSDIDAAIGSVNQGGIFRYMTKPWDIPQLEVTLRRAMEFFSRETRAGRAARRENAGHGQCPAFQPAGGLRPGSGVCRHQMQPRGRGDRVLRADRRGRPRTGGDGDSALRQPDWARLHARQVVLAGGIEDTASRRARRAGSGGPGRRTGPCA